MFTNSGSGLVPPTTLLPANFLCKASAPLPPPPLPSLPDGRKTTREGSEVSTVVVLADGMGRGGGGAMLQRLKFEYNKVAEILI